MVGAGGQVLDRSLVDRMVYAPERLVFEGAPVLAPPLVQDQESRRPKVFAGSPLDTVDACPPLRIVDQARLKDLKSRSAHVLAPARAKAREHFIEQHAKGLSECAGISGQHARRIIERQCEGVLLPDVVLPWDDDEYKGCTTVADVLRGPARFAGATLADPLEGVAYGSCKAKVMRRADGTPWIHSFAHGRTVYELKYDAKAASAAVEAASVGEVADTFVYMAIHADIDAVQIEALRNQASEKSGANKRILDAKLRAANKEHTARAKQEDRSRRAAERQDPRPQIPAPPPDAPWLPQMGVLNDILGACRLPVPPMRDIEGVVTQVRVRRVPNMHLLTPQSTNEGEPENQQQATEQPLLTRLDDTQLAELIERHVDYVNQDGLSVHLAGSFVRHYLSRTDNALPIVSAIATLPIVLQDGTLLSDRGLDRKRGIVFLVQPNLLAVIPKPEECTPAAVAEAMRFLTDEWLVDVSTSYAGKCLLLAAALTIVERSVLTERPAFFVTAARRGGGKTTALMMLLMAVTGIRPSASAWSPNEEERRKALLTYLREAMPALIWDNIPRGTQISCRYIEQSCTTAFYSDRLLGANEMVVASAATVHLFTGNNIGPKGDLSSRSLQARLEVERPDPENRPFRNPDPVGWTETHRSKILRALYTIMLGNPVLNPNSSVTLQTRFKTWWKLVGSAVENAAKQHVAQHAEAVAAMVEDADKPGGPGAIDFRDLFLRQEDEDEEGSALADALTALAGKWGRGKFEAKDVATFLNDQTNAINRSNEDLERVACLREFLFPQTPPNQVVSAKSLGKALKRHSGEPVKAGDGTLVLKEWRDPAGGPKGTLSYFVHVG
jgi:hypothetical protein